MDSNLPSHSSYPKATWLEDGWRFFKGNPEFFVAKVKAGTVLFEMQGVSEEVAREAMRLASHKLPVKCKFIKREDA